MKLADKILKRMGYVSKDEALKHEQKSNEYIYFLAKEIIDTLDKEKLSTNYPQLPKT